MTEVELVDIVDLSDRVVGVAPRAELVDRGLNFRVVHVLVGDRAGRLILQRPARARRKAFQWGSSVAGHVRSGESYDQAARREYREELGVEPPELTHVGTTWLDEDGRRKFIGVFVAEDDREFRPDPEEVEFLSAHSRDQLWRFLREPGVVSVTLARVLRYAHECGALERR
jgi:8-oxo-dGTP pyrophosphatase MutT (NUDIX family)